MVARVATRLQNLFAVGIIAVLALTAVPAATGQTTAAGEWTWIGGSNAILSGAAEAGVYGTLGAFAPGNIPPPPDYAANWTDSSGHLWLFGGFGVDSSGNNAGSLLNALWEFNPSLNEWALMSGSSAVNQFGVYGTLGTAAAGNAPGGRLNTTTWTDGSGNLWLFGGQGYAASGASGELNDLWEFNVSTSQWAWISGSNSVNQSAVYGTLGVYAAGSTPGARMGALNWTDSSGHVWLFGGSGPAGSFSDLWEFNPSTRQWAWIGGSSAVNQPGVYGTLGIGAAGNIPPNHRSSAAWTDISGNLWFFGGNISQGTTFYYANDLWKFNPSTKQWAWMGGNKTFPSCTSAYTCNPLGVYGTLGTPAAGNFPGGREYTTGWTDSSGNFWLFGGNGAGSVSALGPLNDLWEFSPSTNQWTWMGGPNNYSAGVYGTQGTPAAGNIPGAREYPLSWSDGSGHVWIYGGVGYASSIASLGVLNDLWEYQIAATVPAVTVTPSLSSVTTTQGLTVTVGVSAGSDSRTATGSVVVTSGGYTSASAALIGGSATIPIPAGSLAVGTDTLTATYTPDSASAAAYAVASGSNTVAVSASPTTLTLAAAPTGSTYGAQVVLSASLSPYSASSLSTDGETVTFYNGTTSLGTGTLTSGVATLSVTSLPPGTNSLTAVYAGDANFTTSTTSTALPFGVSLSASAITTAAGEWTLVSGNNAVVAGAGFVGVYGTLGTFAPGNIPIARTAAVNWTDSSGHLWLFGGLAASDATTEFNDMWEYDPSTNQWAWMGGSNTGNQPAVYGTLGTPAAGNVPGSREGGVTWTDSNGNFWMYGGVAGMSPTYFLDDLWEFNPSTKLWTWMGGNGATNPPAVYGTLGVAAAGNTPGGRWGSTAWTDASGNLWLFSGESSTEYRNDLWKFNPSTSQWAWMGGSSAVNQPGVYGTLGVAAAGNIPPSHFGSAAWTDSSGNFWFFGGYGYNGTYVVDANDLWKFNPSTNQWAWMGGSNTLPSCASCALAGVYGTLGTPATGNIPGSRQYSASWTDGGGNFWLFGGRGAGASSTTGYLNDLWEFSPSTSQWAWMGGSSTVNQPGVYGTLGTPSAGNIPSARMSVAASTDGSQVFLFGGRYGNSGPGVLAVYNDMWEYQMAASAPAVTVTPSLSSLTTSQGLTVTVAVSAGSVSRTATGSVVVSGGGYTSASTALSSGSATIAVPAGSLAVGTDTLTASYTPDSGSAAAYASASGSNAVAVSASLTTLTLSGTPTSSTYGQQVVLSATLSPYSASSLSTNGDLVTFLNGSTSLGTGTLSSGVAMLNVTALPAGTNSLTAVYAGDTNFVASTSSVLSYTVSPGAPTIAFSVPNRTYGDAPFTVTATSNSSGAISYSVVSGPATVSVSTVTLTGAGTVVLQAREAAAGNYLVATQNATFTVAVEPQTITFAPPVSPVSYGVAPITLVASGGASGNAVIFSVVSGPGTISGNTLTITGAGGTVVVAANQAGNANYAAAAQVAQSIVVLANPVPVISGISPSFTDAGGATSTLTVNGTGFISGSTVYWGSAALTTTYASATQVTAQLPAADIATAGTFTVTVQTAAPGGGTSNAWQFEVNSSGSTGPTISSSSATVTAGSSASYAMTFPSSVTGVVVSCLNLPAGATCNYSSSTNTVTIATSSTTPKGTYLITLVFTETVSSAAFLVPILLLPLGLLRRKRSGGGVWLTACMALVLLGSAALAIGCGGWGGAGSATGPSTRQVTSSSSINLTIQ